MKIYSKPIEVVVYTITMSQDELETLTLVLYMAQGGGPFFDLMPEAVRNLTKSICNTEIGYIDRIEELLRLQKIRKET